MGSLKFTKYIPRRGVIKGNGDFLSPDQGLEALKPKATEVPVGGIAYIGGKKYRVVLPERNANCFGCSLLLEGICQKQTTHPCSAYSRVDQTWIIFKEITDGSSKQSNKK